jgi:hypothetical protein
MVHLYSIFTINIQELIISTTHFNKLYILFLHTKMSELFTRITFSATIDKRTISDEFVLIQGEIKLLCEYLANKNLLLIDKLFIFHMIQCQIIITIQ